MLDVRGIHHVTCGLWLLALAAFLGLGEATPEPPPEVARAPLRAVPVQEVESVPAEPASPAAAARTLPEPAAPPASAPTPVTESARAEGAALLADPGRFPALTASYQGLRSFRHYAELMTALGGRFVVVKQQRIVGEVDPLRGEVREARVLGAYSPRARDYSQEPALAGPSRRVAERFGAGAEIMLLVPRSFDADLFGGIARTLAATGHGHREYREIEGRYERGPAGGLRFRLVSGLRTDGRRVPLSGVLALASNRRPE